MRKSLFIVVPLPLESTTSDSTRAGDTAAHWKETTPVENRDHNFHLTRADVIVGFPRGPSAWAEFLELEVHTMTGQGFDVIKKGLTIILKKNGKMGNRLATVVWFAWDNTSVDCKFGMLGDNERYEG